MDCDDEYPDNPRIGCDNPPPPPDPPCCPDFFEILDPLTQVIGRINFADMFNFPGAPPQISIADPWGMFFVDRVNLVPLVVDYEGHILSHTSEYITWWNTYVDELRLLFRLLVSFFMYYKFLFAILDLYKWR